MVLHVWENLTVFQHFLKFLLLTTYKYTEPYSMAQDSTLDTLDNFILSLSVGVGKTKNFYPSGLNRIPISDNF